MPDFSVALTSLPRMSSDSALLGAAVVSLLTLALAARAILAWRGLSARAAAARRRQARVESAEEVMHGQFRRIRDQAQQLNATAENALWSLPRLDERIELMRATLADDRALLAELARDEGSAMRGTFARIRGTLSVLRSARELRRTILG